MSRLHKQGYLVKQGGGPRYNWKERWFILDPDEKVLRYFESPQHLDKPKGVIELTDSVLVDPISCYDATSKENCFGIRVTRPAKRTYYMFDRRDELAGCTAWLKTITVVWKKCNRMTARPESFVESIVLTDPMASTATAGGSEGDFRATQFSAGPSSADVAKLNHFRYYSETRSQAVRAAQSVNERLKTRVYRLLNEAPAGSREAFERKVVNWQPDTEVDACPYCNVKFSTLFRRSHCRTCGKVVCGKNPQCSTVVELIAVAKMIKVENTLKVKAEDGPVARLCLECKGSCEAIGAVEKRKGSDKSRFATMYSEIEQEKTEIERLLTRYGNLYGRGGGDAGNVNGARAARAEISQKLESMLVKSMKMEQLPECTQNNTMMQVAKNLKVSMIQWQQPRKLMMQQMQSDGL